MVQNHEPTDCRQVYHGCYYNIRDGVGPICETYNATFIQRTRTKIPKNIKQYIKLLNGGRKS